MKQSYDADEAEQILKRAATRSAAGKAVSRERLLAMAEELGLTPEEIDAATAEMEEEQEAVTLRREFIAERRSGLWGHFIPFLCVNLMLFVINVLTGFGHPWFLYPLMGWGIGMASHAYEALPTRGPKFEKEFEQWRQKRTKQNQQQKDREKRRERRVAKREERLAAEATTADATAAAEAELDAASIASATPPYQTTTSASSDEKPNVVRAGRGSK